MGGMMRTPPESDGFDVHRDMLTAQRRRLSDDPAEDGGGEASLGDAADLADGSIRHAYRVSSRADRAERLAAVDAALAALDNGTYGVCRHCGQPIPRERLDIRPQTVACVSCA